VPADLPQQNQDAAAAWLTRVSPGWTHWHKRSPDPDNSGWQGSQFTAEVVLSAFRAGQAYGSKD
jgi:hypothetical protein